MSVLHNNIVAKAMENEGKISIEVITSMMHPDSTDKKKSARGVIKRMIANGKLIRYRVGLYRVPTELKNKLLKEK